MHKIEDVNGKLYLHELPGPEKPVASFHYTYR